MRYSFLFAAGLFAWIAYGCGTGEAVDSTPDPASKLSRRDARIAAARQRRLERQVKAADAASRKGVGSPSTAKGSEKGGKKPGKARPGGTPGSIKTTSFVDGEIDAGDLEALEELERLWTEAARLMALPSPADPSLANAIAALLSYAEWTLEQMDQRRDKTEAAALSRSAVVHYLRAAECLSKAGSDPASDWYEQAEQRHQSAVEVVGVLASDAAR